MFCASLLAVDVAIVTVLKSSAQRRTSIMSCQSLLEKKKIHVGTKLSGKDGHLCRSSSLIKGEIIFNSGHCYNGQLVDGIGNLIRTVPNALSDAVAQFLCA